MWAEIAAIYHRTKKPKDVLWNRFVARPAAAVLLVPLERSRITPNQITFASLFVFVAAAAILIGVPGQMGLLLGVVVIQLSYVLDCVDGQLARLRGTSSSIGAYLDFLMDELKAFVLVAACGLRLYRADGDPVWVIEALLGLLIVATAISLTAFVRRPEYIAATGVTPPPSAGIYDPGVAAAPAPAPAPPPRRSPLGRIVGLVEAVGRLAIHYPSYLVFIAIADRLDLFLHVYVAFNGAYAGRSLLGVLRRLGRSAS